MRIIVYHTYYGCETGCCGYSIEVDGSETFFFAHPHNEDPRAFAEGLVRKEYGEEHVADLDWDNCCILDD